LALTPGERQALLDTLNNQRFVDTAPAALHATLLDEGSYLGSVRTMYRLLAADGSCRERRALRRHPTYSKPELLATAPIRSGRGTSPSSRDRPSGQPSIST
jgi:hypothetical protein